MQAPSQIQWRSWLFDLGFAVLLAVALGGPSVQAVAEAENSIPVKVLLITIYVVQVTALVGRRRWPQLSFVVVSLGTATIAATPDLISPAGAYPALLLPATLWFGCSLYAASAYAAPPWPALSLGVGLLGSAIAVIRIWSASLSSVPALGLRVPELLAAASLALTFAAWGLGRYRALRIVWQRTLSARSAAAERARIARDMHDVVAHSLAVMVGQAEGGRMISQRQPDRVPEVFETIATTGRSALGEMRGILGLLAATPSAHRPEPPVIRGSRPRMADLALLIERVRRAGTVVELTVTGKPLVLSTEADLAAYRVVQESLTNVIKHAGPHATATVSLAWSADELSIEVTDDGQGSQSRPEAAPGSGRGLAGLRSRLAELGATVRTDPSEGRGFSVSAKIPAEATR